MSNSNINNKKKNVPTGINLNDKDYLTNLLTLLKDMEKNLTVALTECSNEKLYKELKTMFDEYSAIQREAYELMFKNGWYQLECAPKAKVSNLLSNLNSELNDLE